MIEIKSFDFGRNRFLKLSSLKQIQIYEVAFNERKVRELFNKLEKIVLYRHHNLFDESIRNILNIILVKKKRRNIIY